MAANDTSAVREHLAGIDPTRRKDIQRVRAVIRENLPAGFEETVDFGMLAYVVPLDVLPDTYNGHPLQLAALAAQKNYNSLYLLGVYSDPATTAWFQQAFARSGKKLDMGKSCVRFRRADDLPLDVVGAAIGRFPLNDYVERYRASRARRTKR